ncbi:hypothetical protein M6B38_135565 [Iris pallida]|uniref:Uncharacterized protein n=1 Tax=Iris pallida TaxID=29817 RepID=A0AAX6FFK1_IRIPA|nr:hypothetical protein M6B38_135565 [Iris pallida]
MAPRSRYCPFEFRGATSSRPSPIEILPLRVRATTSERRATDLLLDSSRLARHCFLDRRPQTTVSSRAAVPFRFGPDLRFPSPAEKLWPTGSRSSHRIPPSRHASSRLEPRIDVPNRPVITYIHAVLLPCFQGETSELGATWSM